MVPRPSCLFSCYHNILLLLLLISWISLKFTHALLNPNSFFLYMPHFFTPSYFIVDFPSPPFAVNFSLYFLVLSLYSWFFFLTLYLISKCLSLYNILVLYIEFDGSFNVCAPLIFRVLRLLLTWNSSSTTEYSCEE